MPQLPTRVSNLKEAPLTLVYARLAMKNVFAEGMKLKGRQYFCRVASSISRARTISISLTEELLPYASRREIASPIRA